MAHLDKSIRSPDDPNMAVLCGRLRECRTDSDWPTEQLRMCGEYGVYKWFLSEDEGGLDWSAADIVRGYLALSSACLTTTFVITQRMGAVQRIASSQNRWLKCQLLPDLVSGKTFSTLGISHLTTSRRHLSKSVLRAREVDNGFELNGFSPWVTGAIHADTVVLGATLEDDRQILIAVPREWLGLTLSGVTTPEPPQLVALNGSKTGQMKLDSVRIGNEWLIDGPFNDLMQNGNGANTGGLQTSTLAVGLGRAAIEFLEEETKSRSELRDAYQYLRLELHGLEKDLIELAEGASSCSAQDVRTRANSFVLRATQASLAAAKGTGFLVGHPAGRWCTEALFFLVWSCPQSVMQANLCELAGISD